MKEGKPAPDIFLLAASELGTSPEECIFFEDALSGIKAGISAGVGVIIAIMDKSMINSLEELAYDKNRCKLIVIESLDEFDFSLILKQ